MEISPFYLFLAVAVALLAVEIAVFQLSVFWFLFAGLGAAITAAVCWFMPAAGWTFAMGVFVASTAVVFALLYPVLKRFQQAKGPMAGNDAVGQAVEVLTEIAPGASGRVSWSGREWDARLSADAQAAIPVGGRARIVAVEGISLTVRASDS